MLKNIEDAKDIFNPKKAIKSRKIVHARKNKIPARSARRSVPVLPAVPAVVPPSTGSMLIRARSIDKPTKPSKATIFKSSSTENLPLRVYRYLFLCGCDRIYDMRIGASPVTIVAIIKKIENKIRREGVTLRFAIVT
jgi:hypothetical protein